MSFQILRGSKVVGSYSDGNLSVHEPALLELVVDWKHDGIPSMFGGEEENGTLIDRVEYVPINDENQELLRTALEKQGYSTKLDP